MLRAIIILLSYAFLTLLTSCGDDPVNTEVNNNLVTVQLVESGTKKPIANQKIDIYYALDASGSSNSVNIPPYNTTYGMSCTPNPFRANCDLRFSLKNPSIVSLTINDPINDTIIKNLCTSENYESGIYTFSFNSDGLESQVFKAKLFVNNTLVDSLTILKSTESFVIIVNEISQSHGKPFMSTVTDANGNFTVDISKFRYFGQIFRITDYSGRDGGAIEVINGFQAITEFDDGTRKEEYTVRLSNRLTNKYIWKIDNN